MYESAHDARLYLYVANWTMSLRLEGSESERE